MPRTKSTKSTTKTAFKKAATKKVTAKKTPVKKSPVEKEKISSVRKVEKVKTTKTASTVAKKKKSSSSKLTASAKEIAKTLDKNMEPHALNDDVTEKVRELIHLSREQGYLTYKNIDQSLPEIANQLEELQNVISIFNNLEIKLLDSNEVDKFKKKKEESEEESARSNQSDMLDDPVRMYLKQMGQVPLLSREEEVDISKRIETAESSALKIIYSVSLTANFQLNICKKLIAREERFDRVVLDKKIDSRESYFKNLAKQVIALEDAIRKINNAWISIENAANETQRKRSTTRFKNYEALLAPIFKKCCLKLKVFEDFLNPLLTIKLDVSGQIPVETERVYIERYIFDSQDLDTVDQFDELYKGSSELTKEGLESDIAENSLKYHLDSSVIEMPIRTVQYSGKFDVTKISNEQRSQIVDGITRTKTIKLFTLNKLTYSDSSKSLKETEVLKINESLIVNSGEYRTRYVIKSIDSSTSQVELELIEGYEAIKIGSQSLSVYRDIDNDLDVEINVGFDERQVIFIKPIDPISNITSDEYSPGIAFYSNELKIAGGVNQTLSEYYKTEVSDFGQFIKALSVDSPSDCPYETST